MPQEINESPVLGRLNLQKTDKVLLKREGEPDSLAQISVAELLSDNLSMDLSTAPALVVLTDAQAYAKNIYLEETLTQNTTFEFPNLNRTWNLIDHSTRNGFLLFVRKAGGASQEIYAGEIVAVQGSL